MTTVRDIIIDAGYANGAFGQNITPQDADVQTMFRQFKRLVDSWSNEKLMVFDIYVDQLSLTPNVATYSTTLLSQGRPISVDSIYVRNSNIDYPVDLISNQTYGEFAYKITPGIPAACWYDGSFPDGTFNFYPQPYAPFTAFVSCRRSLTAGLSTLDTVLAFPPGYELAFVSGLAMSAAKFMGLPVSPELAQEATKSKATLQRTNYMPLEMDAGWVQRYPNSNSFIVSGF